MKRLLAGARLDALAGAFARRLTGSGSALRQLSTALLQRKARRIILGTLAGAGLVILMPAARAPLHSAMQPVINSASAAGAYTVFGAVQTLQVERMRLSALLARRANTASKAPLQAAEGLVLPGSDPAARVLSQGRMMPGSPALPEELEWTSLLHLLENPPAEESFCPAMVDARHQEP